MLININTQHIKGPTIPDAEELSYWFSLIDWPWMQWWRSWNHEECIFVRNALWVRDSGQGVQIVFQVLWSCVQILPQATEFCLKLQNGLSWPACPRHWGGQEKYLNILNVLIPNFSRVITLNLGHILLVCCLRKKKWHSTSHCHLNVAMAGI